MYLGGNLATTCPLLLKTWTVASFLSTYLLFESTREKIIGSICIRVENTDFCPFGHSSGKRQSISKFGIPTANQENEETVPVTVKFISSYEVVTSTHTPSSKW